MKKASGQRVPWRFSRRMGGTRTLFVSPHSWVNWCEHRIIFNFE